MCSDASVLHQVLDEKKLAEEIRLEEEQRIREEQEKKRYDDPIA